MHIVVTGASSGIGDALAREFGRIAGAKLTLIARRKAALEKLAAEIEAPSFVLPHDLSDEARATAWITDAEKAHGPIDVMINNAGVENTGYAAEADPARGQSLLRTNLVVPVLIMRALAPEMIARRGGTLVNIASVASYSAQTLQAWYGASKAGLAMFSEVLRTELRRHRVRVVTVYPGPIATPMAEAAYAVYGGKKSIAGRLPEGSPVVLARLVRRAVERGKKRVIYPGFYKIAWYVPWFARWLGDQTTIEAHPRLSAAKPEP
jgi:short-subunit dehydrogenase